jgi:hypothetical protein
MSIGGEVEGGAIANHMQVQRAASPLAQLAVTALQSVTYRRLVKDVGLSGGLLRSLALAAGARATASTSTLIISHSALPPCSVCLDFCASGPPPPPLPAPCDFGDSWCSTCHNHLGSSSGDDVTAGSSPHDVFPAVAPSSTCVHFHSPRARRQEHFFAPVA